MDNSSHPVSGAGLGLRRTLLGPLTEHPAHQVDFMEVAPENWIGVGGQYGKQFRAFTEHYPFICHGLSLSIGSPSPLDMDFLYRLKDFMKDHGMCCYSEHLSYCSDDGHLYDLMPIPFTEEAVRYVAGRIRQVQDILEQRIAMENISYYAAPGQAMNEIDFFNAVISEADCNVLLDVNNVYVNSVNHGYDPLNYLQQIPGERISYLHIAGHYEETEDLLIDTHGADVKPSVWEMLAFSYRQFGMIPTLLERDFNIPPLPELLAEVDRIIEIQNEWNQAHEAGRRQG